MILALLMQVTLEDLRREDPSPRGLAPFPRTIRVAVAGETDPKALKAVTDYFRRVSNGRLALEWDVRAAFTPSADLDAIRVGSPEETELVTPWVRSAATRGIGAVCLLVPRRGAVRDWFRWPHEGTVDRIPYYVGWPDSGEGETVGVHAHELGHVAGLEDEYLHQPEREGAWCLMSRGYGAGDPPGRDPAPPCAPCRVRLGWMPLIHVTPPKQIAWDDEDACLDLGGPIVERRGDRFLVWENGRLAGIPTAEKPVIVRGAELRSPRAGVLDIQARSVRSRRIDIHHGSSESP